MSSLSPEQQAVLAQAIARHGLSSAGSLIESLACEAVHLTTAEADDYRKPGGTRLGGLPDLARDLPWPTTAGLADGIDPNDPATVGDLEYLFFLAQVNLAELPRTSSSPLPDHGMLYFFLDAWADAGDIVPRLIYHPGGEWRMARPPDANRLCQPFDWLDEEEENALSPYRVTPRLIVSTPNYASYDPQAAEMWRFLGEADLTDAYFEMQKTLINLKHGGPGQGHQVLGYGTGVRLSRLQRETGAEWLLLFEMDSDKRIGTSWSDAGLFHVLIRRDDLLARRFDRVRAGIFSG